MIQVHKAQVNEIIVLPFKNEYEHRGRYDAIGIMDDGICLLNTEYFAVEDDSGELKTIAEMLGLEGE